MSAFNHNWRTTDWGARRAGEVDEVGHPEAPEEGVDGRPTAAAGRLMEEGSDFMVRKAGLRGMRVRRGGKGLPV